MFTYTIPLVPVSRQFISDSNRTVMFPWIKRQVDCVVDYSHHITIYSHSTGSLASIIIMRKL